MKRFLSLLLCCALALCAAPRCALWAVWLLRFLRAKRAPVYRRHARAPFPSAAKRPFFAASAAVIHAV